MEKRSIISIMKVSVLTCLLALCGYPLTFLSSCNAISDPIDNLDKLVRSRRSKNALYSQSLDAVDDVPDSSPVWIGPQDGLRQADRVNALPGQPAPLQGQNINQYAGYVTVDPQAGRSLFYYFVESPQDAATKPLVLWLNGGPGCSSLGYGAMEELGPFRVNKDGKTLYRNEFAWTNAANVLFLETPAGVGFSYSNAAADLQNLGDRITAKDSYVFLMNWLERFPEYKTRDFYITGESYAGHYAPNLAFTILTKNKATTQTKINLKGIAIGNPWIDDLDGQLGAYEYFWTHDMNSDMTHDGIKQTCDFLRGNITQDCLGFLELSRMETSNVNIYDIYAPVCLKSQNSSFPKSTATTANIFAPASPDAPLEPCADSYVEAYLNLPEVKAALHVKPTIQWKHCGNVNWNDAPLTMIPRIRQLMASGIRFWIFSGDQDGRVPTATTKLSLNKLRLRIVEPFRSWVSNGEVGGYATEYQGLAFITVRGAGHMVPSSQPRRAFNLFSSFLQGTLPPDFPENVAKKLKTSEKLDL